MQYAERVSIRHGSAKSPILLVAPHAAPGDDVNTDIIIDTLAELLNCHAVVNRGWQRAEQYDYYKDQADCNNVLHMTDVVADEFLDPFWNIKTQILRNAPTCHVFWIHGMIARKGVDVIIGYGAGTPNSFSCSPWRKNLMYKLLENESLKVWVGKAGGAYSGWSRNNMNQFFRKHKHDDDVQSMQLELSRDVRTDRGISELTAEYLASAMKDYINYDSFNKIISPGEI